MERKVVSEQLRGIIEDEMDSAVRSDVRSFCRQIGVSQASISRFLRGERDLALSTVDRICSALGYELAPIIRPLRQKRRDARPKNEDDGEPF